MCIPYDNISKDTYNILMNYELNPEKYKSKINDDEYIFLVDHNETIYDCSRVIGCIDHHPTVKKHKYNFYINMPSAATAKHIFDLFITNNISVSRRVLELVVLAMYVDTNSLKNTKARDVDKKWINDIAKKYEFDLDKFYRSGFVLTDMKNSSTKELSHNGLKNYKFRLKIVKSSYIQIDDINNYRKEIEFIIDYLSQCVIKENLNMWVFIVLSYKDNSTIEYRITKDVIEEYSYEKILSRGKDIMPIIEEIMLFSDTVF